jgi:hypothetical protein
VREVVRDLNHPGRERHDGTSDRSLVDTLIDRLLGVVDGITPLLVEGVFECGVCGKNVQVLMVRKVEDEEERQGSGADWMVVER